jgi:hypothetical protein
MQMSSRDLAGGLLNAAGKAAQTGAAGARRSALHRAGNGHTCSDFDPERGADPHGHGIDMACMSGFAAVRYRVRAMRWR